MHVTLKNSLDIRNREGMGSLIKETVIKQCTRSLNADALTSSCRMPTIDHLPPCLTLDTVSAGQCPVKLQTEQIAYILQTPSAAAGHHQHSFISICEIFRLFTQLDFNDYPEGLPVWKFICPRIFDC